MMSLLAGGDAWPGVAAASASVVEDYSAPTRVTAVTSATARRPAADGPARLRAKPAGSPGRRTTTTSAAPCTSSAVRPGELVIPAIGARCRAPRLRLKTSLCHKPLILLAKWVFLRAHRYKIS